jgi:hypothetical protein
LRPVNRRCVNTPWHQLPVDERERYHDAGLVVVKALLNAIPLVGGSLVSLVEFIPTATQRNTEKAIGFFRDQLANLETRIDVPQ